MESLQSFNQDCWYHSICKNDCSRCVKFRYIKRLMNMANVPVNLQKPIPLEANKEDLKAFKRLASIKDHIDEFIETGDNLYICSEHTGNGKTSWALKIMFKYLAYVYDICDIDEPQALLIYIPEFILSLKDFNNPPSKSYLNYVKTVPLVIFDDIGTGDISSYDYTQLLAYVNARQLAGLSTIYTSNIVSLDELSNKVGDKLASRIYNTSEIVELKGKDMR